MENECKKKLMEKKNVNRCSYSAIKCPTILTAVNKMRCGECKKDFCMAHRHAWNHDCESLMMKEKKKPRNPELVRSLRLIEASA